nr:MAG TPA: tRNA (uracil-5-)-methyltransferase [Caudoviricetes sp.]
MKSYGYKIPMMKLVLLTSHVETVVLMSRKEK